MNKANNKTVAIAKKKQKKTKNGSRMTSKR